ncbi:uncharacterized protein LOC122808728 isoform X2 [Protopterus annectens]|uniref:uncharacterized protein LOC122808728 isoform X2 n=1 Tax=Protopterus annectens TaxID=7888 RepID=UPI001CFAA7E3|nr:uncharacterized protein LOC122808728 isoform X2 [Protopterus annectens]
MDMAIGFMEAIAAEIAIRQNPPFHFAAANDSVKLQCHIDKDDPALRHYVFWYKQAAGGVPQFLTNCSDEPSAELHFKCKANGAHFSLEISSAQQSDTGRYYCATTYRIYLIMSKGSTLTVGDTFTEKTSVSILSPSADAIKSRQSVPLICLVSGVTSSTVHISWIISDNITKGLISYVQEKQKTFSIRSQVAVSKGDWISGSHFTCQVVFNSSGEPVNKSAHYSKEHTDLSTCGTYAVVLSVVAVVMLTPALIVLCKGGHKEEQRKEQQISEEQQNNYGEQLTYSAITFQSKGKRKKRTQ